MSLTLSPNPYSLHNISKGVSAGSGWWQAAHLCLSEQ